VVNNCNATSLTNATAISRIAVGGSNYDWSVYMLKVRP
jgi:hypothetical protein